MALFDFLKDGICLPMAADTSKEGKSVPSATLWFVYVSHTMATISTINLMTKDALEGAIQASILWALTMIFYRMKQIDKFKLNLKKKSFEMEDTPDTQEGAK